MRETGIAPPEGRPSPEDRDRPEIGRLDPFDPAYFARLEGEDGWIAIGQENCRNQRYFTVKGMDGEELGIVGMYDTDEDRNIAHTVVDPRYRGRGLAETFKERLLDETGEDRYVATVDLDNTPSLRAMEKIAGARVVSDEAYEREFHKRKYVYERPAGKP